MAGNFASLVNMLNRFAALPHCLLTSLFRILCRVSYYIRPYPFTASLH
jgi:hypothetical protein